MADEKVIKTYGDTWKGFASEDGKHYRTVHADFSNTIKHVEDMRELVNGNTNKSKMGWQHIGSIPMPLLEKWLQDHNYTMHEFAINAGGEKGKTDPSGPGVKDKFMKYFLSRDFSKLHNKHITTQKESNFSAGGIYLGGK